MMAVIYSPNLFVTFSILYFIEISENVTLLFLHMYFNIISEATQGQSNH